MRWFSAFGIAVAAICAAHGGISVKDGDRIAFLGASNTQFANADASGFVNLVVDGFRRAGVRVEKVPAGVSGDRSHMMLARFDRDVASKKPAWVVVKVGINDITWQRMNKGNDLPTFEANVNAICDKAEKAGIRVMLVKSTLVGERNYKNDPNNKKLAGYVAAVERIAKARGCLLADAYAAECKALDELKHQWMPYFTTDNLHLNGRGNILMACEILRGFGVDGACIDACRKEWERLPSMTSSAKFVAELKDRLPPCEYAALGRLAAEKGETVEEYAMRTMREEAAACGAWDTETPRLAEKIAKTCPVVKTDLWHGGRRTVFKFKGHEAWVVEPPPGVEPAKGRPWTWTMQWATSFVPRTGVPRLLRKGWHHVTIEQFAERMTEKGLELSREFQKYLVDELGLAPQANLIGMSWGGFFTTRYALAYPELVRKIYLDAPVLTFDGFKHGTGPWKPREPAGGWGASPEMPVNRAGDFAALRIPLLLFYGGVDTVVLPQKNCLAFIAGYKAAGGKDMEVCPRASFAHHPHGVETDNTTISDFFADEGCFAAKAKKDSK